LHKESHQNMNSVEMYRSVTKWATTITTASVIPEIVAKAVKIATSGRPGAVLIELPEDVAKERTDAKPFKINLDPLEIGTTKEHAKQACSLIAKSKKPIVLLGDAANSLSCNEELKAFLEKSNCYATYTFMSKGAIDSRYERSLHCVGLGFNDLVIKAFQESDCVICIGYHMIEYPPARWNVGINKKIIHIDIEPAEVDQHYIPELSLVGQIKAILNQITHVMDESCNHKLPYMETHKQAIEAELGKDRSDDGFPMKPKRILSDIRKIMRENDILVSDVGAHKMWIARQYGAWRPKTVLISNGFCSMSGSLPGALEAKRLYPEKNVVAVCGDGGFMMGIQALVTGVELNVPFVVVLWQDDHYGLIKWKQEIEFDKTSNVALHNPNLANLAEAYGCHGQLIQSAQAFSEALKMALTKKDKPTVLVVPVDYSENMKLFKHLREII
jgi:acetolactate synthase I/II/III large subunit